MAVNVDHFTVPIGPIDVPVALNVLANKYDPHPTVFVSIIPKMFFIFLSHGEDATPIGVNLESSQRERSDLLLNHATHGIMAVIDGIKRHFVKGMIEIF